MNSSLVLLWTWHSRVCRTSQPRVSWSPCLPCTWLSPQTSPPRCRPGERAAKVQSCCVGLSVLLTWPVTSWWWRFTWTSLSSKLWTCCSPIEIWRGKLRGFWLDNDTLTYPRHEVVMTLIVFVPDSNHQTLLLDGTKIHLVFWMFGFEQNTENLILWSRKFY